MDRGPAGRGEDVVGGERAARGSVPEARRVVAAGVGVQLGGEAGVGVSQVHVGRRPPARRAAATAGATHSIPLPIGPHSHFWPEPA